MTGGLTKRLCACDGVNGGLIYVLIFYINGNVCTFHFKEKIYTDNMKLKPEHISK